MNRQRRLWSYVLRAEREKLSLCVGRVLQASATLRDGGGSALGSRLSLLYSKQKSSAPLPNLSKNQAGRVAWQVLTRGTPFGSSCQAGTRKAEGSAALPSGADPRTGQRLVLERRRVSAALPSSADPRNRAKGADPRTGTPPRRYVFSVLVSWPVCAGAFLVPGRWFSGPAPSGSCLFWFRLVFLSTGRGRHVPAPSGRDVGSNSGAPTQEPAFSGIPLHSVRFNLGFAYSVASVLIGEVSEAVYECGRGGERSR